MADPTDAAQAPQPQFNIRRIYLKDLSFESPRAPQVSTCNSAPPPRRWATPCTRWWST
jgi:preprotein translocase subunit SecB